MDDFDEFSLITKLIREELVHILESIPGSKELIVETCLMRPLDRIASMSLLKQHNCPRVQQLRMDRAVCWDVELEHRVLLCRPSIQMARKVCELVNAQPQENYSIVLVDRRRNIFEAELEKSGIFGAVHFYEFNLALVPLESDLFSLELPLQIPTSNDIETLSFARTLWQLQSLYGLIPTTFCIGEASRQVEKLFRNLNMEIGEPPASAEQPISHLFLFDRQMDMVSTLMTALTYESLLNDTFAYSCGKISFGKANMKLNGGKESRTFPLNNSDAIFSAIRNEHMTKVFPFLSAKAKLLQSAFEKASGLKELNEVKHFVTNELRSIKEQHRQLEMHIGACEALLQSTKDQGDRFGLEKLIVQGEASTAEIVKFVEASCGRQPPWRLLQLLCLWSIVDNGIPSKYYRQFQVSFLRAYGYEFLPLMQELKRKGLLEERLSTASALQALLITPSSNSNSQSSTSSKNASKTPTFSSIATALKLCGMEENTTTTSSNETKSKLNIWNRQKTSSAISSNRVPNNPTESSSKTQIPSKTSMGYMFSEGYIPLIAKLVELIVSEGWNEPKLRRIFGDSAPFYCTNPLGAKPDNRIRKAILVGFVGGCTFAEISALRCFAQNSDFRIIIVTTSILRREEYLKSLAEII